MHVDNAIDILTGKATKLTNGRIFLIKLRALRVLRGKSVFLLTQCSKSHAHKARGTGVFS
jgi:hypothetical protein